MATLRNLTDADQNRRVLYAASELLERHGAGVVAYDQGLTQEPVNERDPVVLQAARCAHARFALTEAVESVLTTDADTDPDVPTFQVSIVWAMYRETVRLRSPSEGGQDFLRHKIEQVRWLTHGLPIGWRLVAVDDGCPDIPSSAQVARELLASLPLLNSEYEEVRVVELQDGIGPVNQDGLGGELSPAFRALDSTDQSRKGGAIVYGLWSALNESASEQGGDGSKPDDPRGENKDANHLLLYTDADLSANLAEAGLLMAPIISGAADVVAGQRYGLPGAVLIDSNGPRCEPASTGNKPDKMIVLFRHFVRGQLFPQLCSVPDTQAGFKAFAAGPLRKVLSRVEAFDETFDVELLIRSGATAVAPITFVEDFDSSNFRTELTGDGAEAVAEPGERHFAMITQLLEIYDRLRGGGARSDGETADPAFLSWLRSLDLSSYQDLIRRLQHDDATQRARGEVDPLFDTAWTLDQLNGRPSHPTGAVSRL